MQSVISTLAEYGAHPDKLHFFDQDGPQLLPYATLTSPRRFEGATQDSDLSALIGVYEWQNNPLMFLVSGDELSDEAHFRRIRRKIALRGDAPYLGIVQAGQLTVHKLALDKASRAKSQISIASPSKITTFACLANQRPEVAFNKNKWISGIVLGLLRESIDALIKDCQVSNSDAVSLVGRALFVRFLGDRGLVPDSIAEDQHAIAALFDNAAQTEATSEWLDDTFNGDFLPLSPSIFQKLNAETYRLLGNILRRAEGGQLHLGWEQKWAYLDFAHIPVGVLSQAYEQYMRDHATEQQRKEGSYYTPRAIVELMIQGAFHALRRDMSAHQARVLDPAVGAGVFLLAAFRQLAAERWQHDGKRPNTRILRDILYQQLVGFDINEQALRFAALGLYLMAIELDPEPEPIEKLRFDNLRDRVLFKVSDDESQRSLGSLDDAVGPEHNAKYDLVVGNPPWTTSTKLPNWSKVKGIVAEIASQRLPDNTPAPPLPNECLDEPFVWRAMQWARPGGQIAFALHARLLFQHGKKMPEARQAIFAALDVTGVLNGAELRSTAVWPKVDAPFCLFFANNQLPPPGAAFRFVTPHIEEDLNSTGVLRIDASNAELITVQQLDERPEIFKILFRGSQLDLEIYERIACKQLPTLDGYWQSLFGEFRGRPRQAGNGYKRLNKATKKPIIAHELLGLPELTSNEIMPLIINTDALPLFKISLLDRKRVRALYTAPLLIVHKSPPVQANRIRVAVSENDLVFSETYYGYSAANYLEGQVLVRYLALLISSKLAFWYTLMSSGEFGFEREVVEKITIDDIPVIPLEALPDAAKKQINPLFDALVQEDSEENWARVDDWVASLYGLSARDLQVIEDTLQFNLPFAKNRELAQSCPSQGEVADFCRALSAELQPWTQGIGGTIEVYPANLPATSPWEILQIRRIQSKLSKDQELEIEWEQILRVADELGSSEVSVPDEENGVLYHARLRQARYWSISQARLLAQRIVWEHLDLLVERASA